MPPLNTTYYVVDGMWQNVIYDRQYRVNASHSKCILSIRGVGSVRQVDAALNYTLQFSLFAWCMPKRHVHVK